MREIKFRAKRIDDGKWVYGYYWTECINGFHFIREKTECGGYEDFRIDPNTLGQYTGLKDKNGVEIYEGDIVKRFDTNKGAEICWKKLYAQFEFREMTSFVFQADMTSYYEIIGHIYENPELLKP